MVTVSEALSRVRHLVRLKIDKIKFKVCKKDRMIKNYKRKRESTLAEHENAYK